jgi:hypothetical protein
MTIFKVGDRVYDGIFGEWGTIVIIGKDQYPIYVEPDIKKPNRVEYINYTEDGYYSSSDSTPRLSFTEYDLIHGGFSQERPQPVYKPFLFVFGLTI